MVSPWREISVQPERQRRLGMQVGSRSNGLQHGERIASYSTRSSPTSSILANALTLVFSMNVTIKQAVAWLNRDDAAGGDTSWLCNRKVHDWPVWLRTCKSNSWPKDFHAMLPAPCPARV